MREIHQPLPRESLTCEHLCQRVASQEAGAEVDTVNLLLPFLTKKLAMKADMNLVADLVQETLMALIVKMRAGKIQQPSALKYYAYSIANHLLIKQMTIAKRMQEIDIDDLELMAGTPSVEQVLELQQQRLVLMTAISKMPQQRDRTILTALFIGMQDKLAVCQQWDILPADYDRIVSRAKQRLTAIVNAQD